MTTLRLPTLPIHSRGLGDLTSQPSRRPHATVTSGNDRPSFGDSLREAAQKRPDRSTEQVPSTDDIDETDSAQTDDIDIDESDDGDQSPDHHGTDQPVATVDTNHGGGSTGSDTPVHPDSATPDQAVSAQSHTTLSDPLAAQVDTPRVDVTLGPVQSQIPAESADADAQPHMMPEQSTTTGPAVGAEQQIPANAVEPSLVVTTETPDAARTDGTDVRSNVAAIDPLNQAKDESSGRQRGPSDQQSSNTAQRQRQPVPVQSAGSGSVDVPDDSVLRPSEQIAAGVRRETTGEQRETRRQATRGPAASVRAQHVQQGLQLEQMTGIRAGVQPTQGTAVDQLAAIGGAASPETGSLHGLNSESRGGDARTLPDPALDRVVSSRIVRGLSSMLQQRGGAMTMRLDPPELGQLRVQMSIARGVVNAQFMPGTARAQHLIERNMATLRTALESQGLSVDRLTVHAAASTSGQGTTSTGQDASQHGQQAQSDTDAGQGQSRGRENARRDGDTPATFASMVESNEPRTTFDQVAQRNTESTT